MLSYFVINLLIVSAKILIHFMSFTRIFNKFGFIPSGPADFLSFICCVTSYVGYCVYKLYMLIVSYTYYIELFLILVLMLCDFQQ